MDAVLFILFSTIEVLAYFYISFVIFRYKIKYYLVQVSLASIFYSTISYFFRFDSEVGPLLGPFLSMLLLFMLTYVLLRERFIFNMVMAISGYLVFMTVQTLLAIMVVLITGFSFSDLGNIQVLSRAMQLLTSVTLFGIGHFLFRRGVGFTFTLKRLSSRWEYPIVMSVITLVWIQVAVVLFYRSLFAALIVSIIGIAAFLYYGIKKEINLVMRKD